MLGVLLAVAIDGALLISLVLTLTGALTTMYLVRMWLGTNRFAKLVSWLAAIALLLLLFSLGVQSAGYVLIVMVILLILAFFLGALGLATE